MTFKTTIFLRGLAWLYASVWCPLRLKYLRLKIKLAPKIAGIAESCKDALLLMAYIMIIMFTMLPWIVTKLIAELIEWLYDSIGTVLRKRLGYEAAASEVLSYAKQCSTKTDKLERSDSGCNLSRTPSLAKEVSDKSCSDNVCATLGAKIDNSPVCNHELSQESNHLQ